MPGKEIKGQSPILLSVSKELEALGGFRKISKLQKKFIKKKNKISKHPMAKK